MSIVYIRYVFFAVAILLPGPVRSQECLVMSRELAFVVTGNHNPLRSSLQCVTPATLNREICIPSNRVLKHYEIVDREKFNVLSGGERLASKTSDSCIAVQLKGYPADHRGHAPFYLCSEMRWIVSVIVEHCAIPAALEAPKD